MSVLKSRLHHQIRRVRVVSSRQVAVSRIMSNAVVEIVQALHRATEASERLELALKLAEIEPEDARPILQTLDPSCVDIREAVRFTLGGAPFPPLVAFQAFPADLVRGFANPRVSIALDPRTLAARANFTGARVGPPLGLPESPHPLDMLRKIMPLGTVYGEEPAPQAECALTDVVAEVGNMKVYRLTFKTAPEYLRRMLVLAYFFIDGARLPDETDDNWEFFVLAENQEFRAYCSVYTQARFLSSPQFAQGLRWTKRVVHVLALPPHDAEQHAQTLLTAVFEYFRPDEKVDRIVFDDPDENAVVRARAQLAYLTADAHACEELARLDSPSVAALTRFKLEQTQIRRCCELYALQQLPDPLRPTAKISRFILQSIWQSHYAEMRDVDAQERALFSEKMYQQVLSEHYKALGVEAPDEDADRSADEEQESSADEEDSLPAPKRARTA